MATQVRLNRFLAQCGMASRRGAEELILQGQVTINGKIIKDLATSVNPARDRVKVKGKIVEPPRAPVYLAMHKPKGVDVTRGDPHAKQTVFDLLSPDVPPSVQAVGRLDRQTTGLLIMTNDGDLAFRLTHPKHEVEKEYLIFGDQPPTEKQIRALLHGVELEDGPAKAERAGIIPPEENRGPGLKLIIRQGRNRIVRRMCEHVGFNIRKLQRSRVGPLNLGKLKRGEFRYLTHDEVARLQKAVGLLQPERKERRK